MVVHVARGERRALASQVLLNVLEHFRVINVAECPRMSGISVAYGDLTDRTAIANDSTHRSKCAQCCQFVLAKLSGSRDIRCMRFLLNSCLALACSSQAAVKAEALRLDAFDLVRLEKEWHRCVRRSFSGQPVSLNNAAAQRAALDACKTDEDAYVSAVMIAQSSREDAQREDHDAFTSKAKAWVARLSAYVLDPLSSWLMKRGS